MIKSLTGRYPCNLQTITRRYLTSQISRSIITRNSLNLSVAVKSHLRYLKVTPDTGMHQYNDTRSIHMQGYRPAGISSGRSSIKDGLWLPGGRTPGSSLPYCPSSSRPLQLQHDRRMSLLDDKRHGCQSNNIVTTIVSESPRFIPEAHRLEVQAAHASGNLGFGFSAGGFLYCYHLGILWELERLGVIRIGGATLMAGASAGSLAIATFNSGLREQEATKALREFASDCRSQGTGGRLSE